MNLRVVVRSGVTVIGCALLFVAAAVSGCAPSAAPKQDIGEMVASAKSAADHEAIADYYDREATDAKTKYEEHEASVVHYENSVKWRTWAWHCDRLAQDFKAAQGEAQVLATEHRKVAAEMKSGETPIVTGPSPQPAKQSM